MLTLALALGAQAQVAPPASGESGVSKAEAEALIAGCAGRRFEAPFEITIDGKVRRSKVKLCGKPGQSDAEWARTLEDAVRNVESNRTMPVAAKEQVVSAFKAELAKLPTAATAAAPLRLPGLQPRPAPTAPQYSSLPPLPVPGPAARPAPPPAEYSSLPPLRAPVPAAGARPVVRAAASVPKPRLTFRCLKPGEAEGPCSTLEPESLLIVRADEDLASGTSLRFVRRGALRSEVALAPMARGKSVRIKLPKPVCSGVVRSQVEVQLASGSRSGAPAVVAETLGPFDLRC
jgi:hypothetical protein